MMIIDTHENIAFDTNFLSIYRIIKKTIKNDNGEVKHFSYILARHSLGYEVILCGFYMDDFDNAKEILNLKTKNTFYDIMDAIKDDRDEIYVHSDEPAIDRLDRRGKLHRILSEA